MSSQAFEERILGDLLPTFCNDPQRQFALEGFRPKWERISDRDAEDFLLGLDGGLITHVGRGLYRAPRSRASEQFFWQGRKDVTPRTITLWVEPIITVAVLARLHFVHGWPKDLLGTQSADWAFDVTAHLPGDADNEHIACEVKATRTELNQLVHLMEWFGAEPAASVPRSGRELNAFRKVQALRARCPPLFWAVGPAEVSHLFDVRLDDRGALSLRPIDEGALAY